MRSSSNPATQEMMAQYDSNVALDLLPCSPAEERVPCDKQIANGIGYGTVKRTNPIGSRFSSG